MLKLTKSQNKILKKALKTNYDLCILKEFSEITDKR